MTKQYINHFSEITLDDTHIAFANSTNDAIILSDLLNQQHKDNQELQEQLTDCYTYISQLEGKLESLGVEVK